MIEIPVQLGARSYPILVGTGALTSVGRELARRKVGRKVVVVSDAAIAALKRSGGTVVSSRGSTVNLPGRGGATTKVAIVRDPDNLFLVLLPAPR